MGPRARNNFRGIIIQVLRDAEIIFSTKVDEGGDFGIGTGGEKRGNGGGFVFVKDEGTKRVVEKRDGERTKGKTIRTSKELNTALPGEIALLFDFS